MYVYVRLANSTYALKGRGDSYIQLSVEVEIIICMSTLVVSVEKKSSFAFHTGYSSGVFLASLVL